MNAMIRTSKSIALLFAVAACGSDSSTGPAPTGNGSPVGAYAMSHADNTSLPAIYDEGPVSGGQVRK